MTLLSYPIPCYKNKIRLKQKKPKEINTVDCLWLNSRLCDEFNPSILLEDHNTVIRRDLCPNWASSNDRWHAPWKALD